MIRNTPGGQVKSNISLTERFSRGIYISMKRLIYSVAFLVCLSTALFSQSSITRDLPESYNSPGTVDVEIDIMTDMFNMPNGAVIMETLPAGWQVIDTSVSPAPFSKKYYPETNTYKWLYFSASGLWPFTISYSASVPAGETGTKYFSGTLKVSDEEEIQAVGDTSIGQAQAGGSGDINGDTFTDISDVILCLRMSVGLEINVNETPYSSPYNDTLKGLANMNGDEYVDISDVILILRKSVGL